MRWVTHILSVLLVGCLTACPGEDANNKTNNQNNQNNQNNTNNVNNSNNVNNVNNSNNGSNNNTTGSNNVVSTGCNGFDELCDKRFDEVVLPATHNSMSNTEDGFNGVNQTRSIENQLADGIRGFLVDSYEEDGEFYFCHFLCSLGKSRIVDVLGLMKTFLDENPREVIALIIQDEITAAQTETLFEASGLSELVYTHPGGEWPTLQTMIDNNTRVVVTAEVAGPPPAWYHHAWDLYFDTPYSFDSQADFNCDLNRGMATNDLFLVNHWVLSSGLGSQPRASEVNVYDVLYPRVTQCQTERGQIPNMVAVDFYDIGDLFEVVNVLNGVAPAR